MITHHPSVELTLDYASGVASEGVALALATHAALCPACRAQIAELEAVGGALLDAMEPDPVESDLLAATLARLDEREVAQPRPAMDNIDAATRRQLPAPLLRYVRASLSTLRWRSVGWMFHEVRLPLADKRIKVSLMRLRAGSLMPKHTHRGHEYTLVLAGGYQDATGAYGPGDFDVKDTADYHQPVVDEDEECLCLVVLDAPVKLTGTVGRLVNPFLRI
jgi:putative transcriptional regulator